MDITALAAIRAHAAARLEILTGLASSRDADERREVEAAMAVAKADYREAEVAYGRAIATLTSDELAALGIAA